MANTIVNQFLIKNEEGIADLMFYLNENGEIFVSIPNNEVFFSIISKDDWEELKTFIDEQFKN